MLLPDERVMWLKGRENQHNARCGEKSICVLLQEVQRGERGCEVCDVYVRQGKERGGPSTMRSLCVRRTSQNTP